MIKSCLSRQAAGGRARGQAGARARSGETGQDGKASRQAEFAPPAIETLVRLSNHLSYLCGPNSLPHRLYCSFHFVRPDLGPNCLQRLSVDDKSRG